MVPRLYVHIRIGDVFFQCAWYFPEAVSTPDLGSYNIEVGGLNFYIQANWDLYGQDCLMY
jgi:hypothetical protein